MKKFIKGNIKVFVAVVITAVICICGTVYAASQILASDISYRDGTVESALNDLYDKANANTGTVCIRQSGTSLTVSAKYLCELGENNPRSFYVLKVGTDDVELIMERNISDTVGSNTTMTWNDATSFFDENHPGYSLKQTWLTKAKEVKLPDAQSIADAGGIIGWNYETALNCDLDWSYFGVNSNSDTSKRTNYSWLYNYIRGCEANGCSYEYSENDTNHAYGYWTKNMIMNDEINAWIVNRNGGLDYDNSTNNIRRGVRPVIVLSKSQLAG